MSIISREAAEYPRNLTGEVRGGYLANKLKPKRATNAKKT